MSINEIPIWARVLCYALLLTFAITIVFPFMWMVFTFGLRVILPEGEILRVW